MCFRQMWSAFSLRVQIIAERIDPLGKFYVYWYIYKNNLEFRGIKHFWKKYRSKHQLQSKDVLYTRALYWTIKFLFLFLYNVRNNVSITHDRYITTYCNCMTVVALSLLFIYVKFYLYLDSFCLLCKTICMPQVGPNWK